MENHQPPFFSVVPLVRSRDEYLPVVFSYARTRGEFRTQAALETLDLNNRTFYNTVDRLREAGLVGKPSRGQYRLIDPAPAKSTVSLLSEFGSRNWYLAGLLAVQEGAVTVREFRALTGKSDSWCRDVLEGLHAQGVLEKESRLREVDETDSTRGAKMFVQPTPDAAAEIDRLRESGDRDESAIEDSHESVTLEAVCERDCRTVSEIADATPLSRKSIELRLRRLERRDVIEISRRRATKVYRPGPQIEAAVEDIRRTNEARGYTENDLYPVWERLGRELPQVFFRDELYEAMQTSSCYRSTTNIHDELDIAINFWKRQGWISPRVGAGGLRYRKTSETGEHG